MADSLEQRAASFEDRTRRLVSLWRYGSRERVLALCGVACLAAGAPLGWLPHEWLTLVPVALRPWISTPFWLGGVVCLGLTAYRIYRRVTAPLPKGDTKLPALKGAGSFAPEDAELFAQLGRGAELEQLRAWILDDQKPLIVLMGESGVGKTSLLRAGLAHALQRDGLGLIYWEAVPTEPAAGLLHAVQTFWGKAQASPENLAALPLAISTSPRVIVIDQLEQLFPEAHPAVFDLLSDVLQTPPPYRGTWIIAFRREYSATWVDFTLGLPEPVRQRVETLSLKRFSLTAAQRVVAVLAAEAELPVDQKVIAELVNGIAVDGRVSPVDIGVTLLGLGELTGEDGTLSVSLDDFRSSGGPTGLLTRYLERTLALFSSEDRGELVAALLALIDLDRNQRLAEGLPLSELVAKVRPASAERFGQALHYLASGKIRVLEALPDTLEVPSYRLLHERFIEPLRVLSGTVLAEAEQAALWLDQAYRLWVRNRQRSRYLLSGRELRSVLQHQDQLPWGEEGPSKQDFVRRSRRHRLARRAILATACMAVLSLIPTALYFQDRQELATEVRSFNLPEDLGDYLDQFDTLDIDRTFTNFDWLNRSSNLRSLSLTARLVAPASLPPKLEEFICNSCSRTELLLLPSSLRSLKLSGILTRGALPKLPSGLRSLELQHMNSFSFSQLPRNIVSLTLWSFSSDYNLTNPPRNLKLLKIWGDIYKASWLPSRMTDLDVTMRLCEQLKSEWPAGRMPPSLVSLSLSCFEPSSNFRYDLGGVPPALRNLSLSSPW